MPTYFKPWRRKIGVVTLGLACLFLFAWGTSFGKAHGSVKLGQNHLVVSSYGFLRWYTIYDGDWANGVAGDPMWPELKYRWKWQRFGICVSDHSLWQQYRREYALSDWYFITPMAWVSAWLLFPKPRAPKVPEKQG